MCVRQSHNHTIPLQSFWMQWKGTTCQGWMQSNSFLLLGTRRNSSSTGQHSLSHLELIGRSIWQTTRSYVSWQFMRLKHLSLTPLLGKMFTSAKKKCMFNKYEATGWPCKQMGFTTVFPSVCYTTQHTQSRYWKKAQLQCSFSFSSLSLQT